MKSKIKKIRTRILRNSVYNLRSQDKAQSATCCSFFKTKDLGILLIKNYKYKVLTLQNIKLYKIITTCYEVTKSWIETKILQ
jgi:hypothetical protein